MIAAIYIQVMEPPMSADRGRGPNTRSLDTDWWHSNLLLLSVAARHTHSRSDELSMPCVFARWPLKKLLSRSGHRMAVTSPTPKKTRCKTHGREPFRAECRLTIHIAYL